MSAAAKRDVHTACVECDVTIFERFREHSEYGEMKGNMSESVECGAHAQFSLMDLVTWQGLLYMTWKISAIIVSGIASRYSD